MTEKRTASRIAVHHPVSLYVDDDSIPGKLINLSDVGALFAFEGDQRLLIDQTLLGLDGYFRIKPKGRPARQYQGEIVRYYVHEGISYIALRFWQRYQELLD